MIEYTRRMKIILTFTLLMIPGALSFSVMGYSGGKVTITCEYDQNYKTNTKYFCKGQKPLIMQRGWCSDLIKTDIKDQWYHDGRFSLYDDTTASVFTVIITDLNINDSDTYMCGVDISWKTDDYTEVKLTVKEDRCCEKIISLSVTSGESVNISCKYPQSHSSDVKFFCRRSEADKCAHETSVKESKRWIRDREILLYDDRDQNLLYVTITNVTDHGSAEYWCGVQSQTEVKFFITRVQLTVNGASKYKTSTPPSLTSLSSLSSSSSSFSPSAYISSALVTPLLTRTSHVIPSDALFISLSVVLVLIIGLLLLMLILCKRHKRSVSDSAIKGSTDQDSRPENYNQVSRPSCDYTEIKDIIGDDIYSTAELPTSIYDAPNSIYSAAQLPTIPSGASNTVYAEVKKNTRDN
ncbi:uncharacterized protein [Paramisgurnus dabryanus]|uniref:uncharacterized protein n=1 Tax=Paramisgurnus dabryanus TaxID=90735 RepID=UPI0031F3A480